MTSFKIMNSFLGQAIEATMFSDEFDHLEMPEPYNVNIIWYEKELDNKKEHDEKEHVKPEKDDKEGEEVLHETKLAVKDNSNTDCNTDDYSDDGEDDDDDDEDDDDDSNDWTTEYRNDSIYFTVFVKDIGNGMISVEDVEDNTIPRYGVNGECYYDDISSAIQKKYNELVMMHNQKHMILALEKHIENPDTIHDIASHFVSCIERKRKRNDDDDDDNDEDVEGQAKIDVK